MANCIFNSSKLKIPLLLIISPRLFIPLDAHRVGSGKVAMWGRGWFNPSGEGWENVILTGAIKAENMVPGLRVSVRDSYEKFSSGPSIQSKL